MAAVIDLELPPGPEGASIARHALSDLEGTLRPALLDSIRLLVSELVTNSIRHAGLDETGWIRLGVEVTPNGIRVEVADPGPGFEPRRITPSIYQTSGWGLYLVDQLSDRWGVIRGSATRVWFEIGGRPTPEASPAA